MKARVKNSFILIIQIVFIACFIILNSGCGLDTVYYLNGPSASAVPVYSSSNPISYTNRYFEFTTNKEDRSEGDMYVYGTDVYYKLYSSYLSCQSEYNSLNTLANSSTSKNSSANSLINTYKFQKLVNYGNSDSDAFIEHDGQSIVVRIRLTTYLQVPTSDDYTAYVKKNGERIGVPQRYYGNRYFDFMRNSTSYNAPKPRTTNYEEDVSSNSSSDSDIWYITLYAVTVGRDREFSTIYSPIVHLGTLAIDAKSYDN